MALITLRDICLRVGSQPLLDRINLNIAPGERICLLGRNGAGKTSLMEIIAGHVTPDGGEVMRSPGLVASVLPQEIPADLQGTVSDIICRRSGPSGVRLATYRRMCKKNDDASGADETIQHELTQLQQTIDDENGWQLQRQVERIISQMNLAPDDDVGPLSAGMKRQVLLAAALAGRPDILLLDEPTNHLDMAAVEWLESFLSKWPTTLLMITHDRMMIRHLATRILEIDRGRLHSWNCSFDAYLRRSQDRLEAEKKDSRRFDKQLAAEEAWIRQGIKARRRRNEGRARRLEALRQQRRHRRDPTGKVRMNLETARRSGKTVVEATDLSFAFGERVIVDTFSCTIMRGDRIGVIGPNGAGKSTLIRLLLGELPPRRGRIRHGTNLQVCYFDQLRSQLDEGRTVKENISPDGDMLDVGGRRRHVIGYLKDFLFSPQRSHTPVWVLSGGEKNRLLLAKLFLQPVNVLVLDEPTNDLDVETLELLEDLLQEYTGTVLLVSHDRAFINNVVTSTLVFSGTGRVDAYAGGYDDWLRQRPPMDAPAAGEAITRPLNKSNVPPSSSRKKLGYMQKRELDLLPDRIETLEARQSELFATMADPDFYLLGGPRIAAVKQELETVQQALENAFNRWAYLESLDTPSA
ncbi:MAG: ATP-binding cassette domain-containing protein [Desulfosarcina sp.]|jgi:ATP-binding cassette subfamily F protein uup